MYRQVFFQETEKFCITATLKIPVWCLSCTEDVIRAQLKLFKHVLVGGNTASMTEHVQRSGSYMELRSCKDRLARSLLSILQILDCISYACLFRSSFSDHNICVGTKRSIIVESWQTLPITTYIGQLDSLCRN